jgi:hypothetical protein
LKALSCIIKYINHSKFVAAIFRLEGSISNRRNLKFLAGLGTSLILVSLLVSPALAAAGDTTRGSVASDGTQGNISLENPSISANGRYVVFPSLPTASPLLNPTNPASTNPEIETALRRRPFGGLFFLISTFHQIFPRCAMFSLVIRK